MPMDTQGGTWEELRALSKWFRIRGCTVKESQQRSPKAISSTSCTASRGSSSPVDTSCRSAALVLPCTLQGPESPLSKLETMVKNSHTLLPMMGAVSSSSNFPVNDRLSILA